MQPLGEQIAALQAARKTLEPKLASLLPDFSKQRIEERRHGLFKAGTPEKLAEKLAMIDASALIPDIALVARTAKAELIDGGQGLLRRHRRVPHRPDRGRRTLDLRCPTIMTAWR